MLRSRWLLNQRITPVTLCTSGAGRRAGDAELIAELIEVPFMNLFRLMHIALSVHRDIFG